MSFMMRSSEARKIEKKFEENRRESKESRRTRFFSPSLASVSAKYRGKRSSSTRFARSVYSRLRFTVAASKQ